MSTVNENSGYRLPDGTDIRSLPKVSLHDHLDGGLRPATIIELGDAIGLDLPEQRCRPRSAGGSPRRPTPARSSST